MGIIKLMSVRTVGLHAFNLMLKSSLFALHLKRTFLCLEIDRYLFEWSWQRWVIWIVGIWRSFLKNSSIFRT